MPRRDRRSPFARDVGDSSDNALEETVNGYFKVELVGGLEHPGPLKTIDELEIATLGWLHWHNPARLHRRSPTGRVGRRVLH